MMVEILLFLIHLCKHQFLQTMHYEKTLLQLSLHIIIETEGFFFNEEIKTKLIKFNCNEMTIFL